MSNPAFQIEPNDINYNPSPIIHDQSKPRSKYKDIMKSDFEK